MIVSHGENLNAFSCISGHNLHGASAIKSVQYVHWFIVVNGMAICT